MDFGSPATKAVGAIREAKRKEEEIANAITIEEVYASESGDMPKLHFVTS